MINRLLTAAAATTTLAAALAMPAAAQTAATAKTEAAAQAATGKASTDKPAATAVQGTAKAVKEGAAPAAAGATNVQATAAVASGAKAVAVNGDLMDTLKLSGQFTTFVKGIDSTNLTGLLKTNKNLTVFAPTDAAFAAMPPAELAALQANKTAMQKFILHHIINAPVDSTKIKGARGAVPSGAGDNVLLDGSEEAGGLKADGANIVQADLRTASGLLHVVDKVLVAGAGGAATPASTGASADASAAAPKPNT